MKGQQFAPIVLSQALETHLIMPLRNSIKVPLRAQEDISCLNAYAGDEETQRTA